MDTQNDSLDISYLKKEALRIGNDHAWQQINPNMAFETLDGSSDGNNKHGQTETNISVAAEIASNPPTFDSDGLPLFSYQQDVTRGRSGAIFSHNGAWNITPRLTSRAMDGLNSSLGDTQPVSQSVYDHLLKTGDEDSLSEGAVAHHGLENEDAGITQKTLYEDDTGHLDLMADLDDTLHAQFCEEGAVSEPDQSSPGHYQPFPESQRFITQTPHRNEQTKGNSTVTPEIQNPLKQGNTTLSTLALSQLFNATQGVSSPAALLPRPEPSSDMPSPNLPVQSRHVPSLPLTPIQHISKSTRSTFIEPQARYISMKESQEARQRLANQSPSKSNFASDNFSDDDLFADDLALKRRVREKNIEIEVRKQFEAVSAPARPDSRRHKPKSVHSSPAKIHTIPGRRSNTNQEVKKPLMSKGGSESELETEKEDGHYTSRASNSRPNSRNGEENKENVEVEIIAPPVPTAATHGALSQSLDTDECVPNSQAIPNNSPELIIRQTQPSNTNENDRIDGSDEERILQSQLSSNGPKGTEFVEDSPANEDMDSPSRILCSELPATVMNPDLRSSPPPAIYAVLESGCDEQLAQPSESETQVPASYSPVSKSGFSDRPGQRSPLPDAQATHSKESNERIGNAVFSDEDVQMASFVLETPAARSVEINSLQHTVPETSPDVHCTPSSVLECNAPTDPIDEQTSSGDQNEPPITHSQNSDTAGGVLRRPKKALDRNPMLSSPSGREIRSLTTIASDQSPQKVPEVQLKDFNILTLEDQSFQAMVLDSDDHVTKRRKFSHRPGIFTSSKLSTDGYQRLESNCAQSELPAEPMSEPIAGPSSTRPFGFKPAHLRRNNTTASKSIWDVDDSPQQKVRNLQPLQKPQKAKKLSFPRRSRGTKKLYSVAEAVVIYNKSSPSPASLDIMPSDPPFIDASPVPNQTVRASRPCLGTPDFSNQIFAFFNGQPHGYYPATCVGITNGIGRQRYLVMFEDSETPDEISLESVKKLELKINDTVKAFSMDLPKRPYRVVELTDKLDTNTGHHTHQVTDCQGHTSAILAPKDGQPMEDGQQTVTVPISRLYLDKNLWSRLETSPYVFVPPTTAASSRLQTPMIHSAGFPATMNRTPQKEEHPQGIFSGMGFAISYTHNEKELSRLERLILKHGGQILKDGFDDLFNPLSPSSQDDQTRSPGLTLTSRAAQLGFVCLITDNYSRRPKYMQALALNLPCLSGRWIDHCLSDNEIKDWAPYLLAAGPSMVLDKAVKSRNLKPYPASTARLSRTITERPKPLAEQTVFFIADWGGAAEPRNPYTFFTCALGPDSIIRLPDMDTFMETLTRSNPASKDGTMDSLPGCIWIYVGDEETARSARKALASSPDPSTAKPGVVRPRGRPPKKRKRSSENEEPIANDDLDEYWVKGRKVRLLDNEFICQVLIFGNLFDGWSAIHRECYEV